MPLRTVQVSPVQAPVLELAKGDSCNLMNQTLAGKYTDPGGGPDHKADVHPEVAAKHADGEDPHLIFHEVKESFFRDT